MGGLRPRLLLYLFKSAKGQASEHVFCILFFYSCQQKTVYNASWCSLTHSVSGILRGGLKSRCSDCAGAEVGIGEYS